MRFALVHGGLSVFITDAHLGPISHEILRRKIASVRYYITRAIPNDHQGEGTHLSHLVLSPETGIMQRGVSMFVGCIGVRFALDQLERNRNKGLHASRNSWSGFV